MEMNAFLNEAIPHQRERQVKNLNFHSTTTGKTMSPTCWKRISRLSFRTKRS